MAARKPLVLGAGGSIIELPATDDADLAYASAAQFRAGTAGKPVDTAVWSAGAIVTFTDAATIAVNMSSFLNAQVTLAGNRTLGAPSNTKVGQTGVIRVIQDATGGRTLSYNAVYKFVGGTAPTLTTTAAASDLLLYFVISSTFILIVPLKDVK